MLEMVMPKNIHVDGREVSYENNYMMVQRNVFFCQLFGRMMRESQIYDEIVVEAIKRIRGG